MEGAQGVSIDITVKFRGRSIPISMALDSTIEELKYILEEHTKVLPRAQKLIFEGKTMEDEKTLKEAEVPNGAKFMLLASQVLQEGGGPILLEAQTWPFSMINSNPSRSRPGGCDNRSDIDKSRIEKLKITGGGVKPGGVYNIRALLNELSTYASYVKVLDLSNSSLPELPIEVGRLSSLMKLDLDGNNLLVESIEWEGLVSLKHLQTLSMNKNRLTKLPSELGDLRSLKQLHLSDNSLSGLPEEIGLLTQLVILKANNNRISSIPTSIWYCTSLVEVDLSRNLLVELPEPDSSLINLEVSTLDLSNNRELKTLPSTLFKMCQKLSLLEFYNTEITIDVLSQFEGWEGFDERRRKMEQELIDSFKKM